MTLPSSMCISDLFPAEEPARFAEPLRKLLVHVRNDRMAERYIPAGQASRRDVGGRFNVGPITRKNRQAAPAEPAAKPQLGDLDHCTFGRGVSRPNDRRNRRSL